MSPFCSSVSSGIPCTITEFIDIQVAAGKPYKPLKDGYPPFSIIASSTISFISLVLIPACITVALEHDVQAQQLYLLFSYMSTPE